MINMNIKNNERYKDFVYLSTPKAFNELFTGYNYSLVQLHDISNYGTEDQPIIAGFSGVFSWIENGLISLDGDSYDEHMIVVGYKEFMCDNTIALDILVKEW